MAQSDACIRVSVEIPHDLVADVDVSNLQELLTADRR